MRDRCDLARPTGAAHGSGGHPRGGRCRLPLLRLLFLLRLDCARGGGTCGGLAQLLLKLLLNLLTVALLRGLNADHAARVHWIVIG